MARRGGPTRRSVGRTVSLLAFAILLLVVGVNLLLTTFAVVAVVVLLPAAAVVGWVAFAGASGFPVPRTVSVVVGDEREADTAGR